MALTVIVVICFLIQTSNANPNSDKTIEALLERLQKLEELDKERQQQIQTLQEQVTKELENNIKYQEKISMQEERILKLETVLKMSEWNEPNVTSSILKRFVIPNGGTTSVAFNAWLKNEIVDVPTGHLIKMTDVKFNEGNGYNVNDGTFFCPTSGLYLFHWSAMASITKSLYLNLRINGVYHSQIYSDSENHYQTSSNLALVRLNAGDHVFVESAGASSSFHRGYCSFSGVRLSD